MNAHLVSVFDKVLYIWLDLNGFISHMGLVRAIFRFYVFYTFFSIINEMSVSCKLG